jgi:predicted aspartyl protease
LVEKLIASGTVSKADFIGDATYRLADGSTITGRRFYLRELIVGQQVVRNVVANLGSDNSPLLLGQSFLSNFNSWAVDNNRHVLILSPKTRG